MAACLVLVLATAQARAARAIESDALLGEWEQVATDAGACPTCRIAFQAAGAGISVAANNGWAARLPNTYGREVVGTGQWEIGRHSWTDGRPFTIRFRMDAERLVMTMTVETSADRTRVVRAIYKRAWQGV